MPALTHLAPGEGARVLDHPRLDSLDDQIPLEFGERGHDVHEQLAGG
jgi:hypothetical protein